MRQERAARAGWGSEWDCLDDESKKQIVRLHVAPPSLESNVGPDVGAASLLQRAVGMESEGVPLPEARSRAVSFFDIGDDTWPVGVDRVASTLAATGREHGVEHRGGVTVVARLMREGLRPEMVISPSTRIPVGVLRYDKTCSEAYPGLCVEDDAAVYADALRLARGMRRCFYDVGKPGALYAFWYSTTIDGPMELRKVSCFGCTRGRDPELAMLANVVADADWSYIDVTIDNDAFSWCPSYAVAKQLLLDGARRVAAQPLAHRCERPLLLKLCDDQPAAHLDLWLQGGGGGGPIRGTLPDPAPVEAAAPPAAQQHLLGLLFACQGEAAILCVCSVCCVFAFLCTT